MERPHQQKDHNNRVIAAGLAIKEFVGERFEFWLDGFKSMSHQAGYSELRPKEVAMLQRGPACLKDLYHKHVTVEPVTEQPNL